MTKRELTGDFSPSIRIYLCPGMALYALFSVGIKPMVTPAMQLTRLQFQLVRGPTNGTRKHANGMCHATGLGLPLRAAS